MSNPNSISNQIEQSIAVKRTILNDQSLLKNLRQIINLLIKSLRKGKKILIAGNGGSAADAQHFAAEMVNRFKKERKAYPTIALTTDTSIITAWANDCQFDTVFARQIEALAKKGDVFIGISTSGNSVNIIQGVKKAKKMGLTTVCLLGKDGGVVKNLTDHALIVRSKETPRIQEAHIMLLHIICQEVEKNLYKDKTV